MPRSLSSVAATLEFRLVRSFESRAPARADSLVMITGDKKETAMAVADELGMLREVDFEKAVLTSEVGSTTL